MLGRRIICTKFTTLSKVRNNSVVFESIVWDYDVCTCVMYVCVCSLANCICSAYAMYVNTRNSHKYTNTYMLFDWVIVLMPGDFLFSVIPLSLRN